MASPKRDGTQILQRKILTVGLDGNIKYHTIVPVKSAGSKVKKKAPAPKAAAADSLSRSQVFANDNISRDSFQPLISTISSGPAYNSLAGLNNHMTGFKTYDPAVPGISSSHRTLSAVNFESAASEFPLLDDMTQNTAEMNSGVPFPSVSGSFLNRSDSLDGLPTSSADLSHSSLFKLGDAHRIRRSCNCTRSMCLKLYCDCFAGGDVCVNCNCENCYNNEVHDYERSKAIRGILDRNPHAFQPKIGGAQKRSHFKGCNCRKSGCLKNYCECYVAKVWCGERCKCEGCRNNACASLDESVGPFTSVSPIHPSSTDLKPLVYAFTPGGSSAGSSTTSLPNSQESRPVVADETPFLGAIHASGDSQLSHAASNFKSFPSGPNEMYDLICGASSSKTTTYLEPSVVSGVVECLLAVGEMTKSILDHKDPDLNAKIERAILQEYGRCVHEIVGSLPPTMGTQTLPGMLHTSRTAASVGSLSGQGGSQPSVIFHPSQLHQHHHQEQQYYATNPSRIPVHSQYFNDQRSAYHPATGLSNPPQANPVPPNMMHNAGSAR